ncbi:unnamed protein product [Brassicogethes aeneus]|uniref:Uncharacterized protein n=1 Tax=Brassicogethes aeneus TaxID=1431903 RepID=A0A9P0B126_BRAAE|nr:unnamed protein product [Brassicogethes aeneus]
MNLKYFHLKNGVLLQRKNGLHHDYVPHDKAKVSDRQAMHILMATVEALEIPADNVVLIRTSLQQLRQNNRHYQFGEAKSEFLDNLSINDRLVVHWDGTILADLVGRSNVDRIAVLVSYNGTSQFLGAPKIE